MATTELSDDLKVKRWLADYFREYVRNHGFRPYMGTGANSCIQVKRDLTSGGKTISMPLVTRLKADGITGSNMLEGNEEQLGNFAQEISIEFLRNGVEITVDDEHYSTFSLLQAARDQLTTWAMDRLRHDLILAFGSIDGVNYADATAAQRNTWTANNEDRVLFGDSRSNYDATHATALENITDAMTLDAATVSLMKRIAKTADPHIRPTRVNDQRGREYFVMFAGSYAFRDLKEDAPIQQANREARPRDVEQNPIFQDGDLIYDGVVIREVPEIESLGGVGATGANVSPVYLCGAQAVGLAWGREPRAITNDRDYRFRRGVGTMEARGIEKLRFESGDSGTLVDHGMVTGYVAAEPDA